MKKNWASFTGKDAEDLSPSGQNPALTDGHLLLDRKGTPLPTHRCFKCNCEAKHQVRRTFVEDGGFWRLLVVLQPLLIPILLPLHLMRRQKVKLSFGLCDTCRDRRGSGLALGLMFVFTSVPFFVYAGMHLASIGPIVGIGGACLLCAGLLTVLYSRHLADSAVVGERWIILNGAGPKFLEDIPRKDLGAAA